MAFIINGAEFSVERLIYRVSQDFSRKTLDTGEDAIAVQHINERRARNQAERAGLEQANTQKTAFLQAKEAFKAAYQALSSNGQTQPATGVPGLSKLDKSYFDAYLIPANPVDISQLLAEFEAEKTEKEGERLYYEAMSITMRSAVDKQEAREGQADKELAEALSQLSIDSPQAFAKQVMEIDARLDDGGRREKTRVAEQELAAGAFFLSGLKAAGFLTEMQSVPAEVAESRDEEEEVERLVLKASYV